MVIKFSDDTKIGGVVDSEEGYLRVEPDLDLMGQWAEQWQMEFNLDKCEVQHFGKANQGRVDKWKDVVKVERVQKRFTRTLPGLEGLSYRERLNRLGLFSLEHWRLRRDLIEVYKIMRGMDGVNRQSLFPVVEESKIIRHRVK
eukprot:g45691.t1